MTIPLYLFVAQWVLLFTLGVLVLVMYRQLGYVFTQAKHGTDPIGPDVGSAAADFEYLQVVTGETHHLFPGDGRPVLLAFVDPTCPACEQLVDVMGRADASSVLSGIRVLLVMSDPPNYVEVSNAFRATQLEIGHVLDAAALAAYQASATPLLVAIDASGVVKRSHPPTKIDDSELRLFISACRSVRPSPETTTLALTSTGKDSSPMKMDLLATEPES